METSGKLLMLIIEFLRVEYPLYFVFDNLHGLKKAIMRFRDNYHDVTPTGYTTGRDPWELTSFNCCVVSHRRPADFWTTFCGIRVQS